MFGHSFNYEMEKLCRVYFPHEDILVINSEASEEKRTIVTRCDALANGTLVSVECSIDGKSFSAQDTVEHGGDCELRMAQLLYELLSQFTGYTPAWGILTGVRPSKLMRRLIAEGGEEYAEQKFKADFRVSESKTFLAHRVARAEDSITALSEPQSFSLYVSIPFCPTRCSYCSFVSHSIANSNAAKLLPPYVDNLCREIAMTGEIASSLGLRLESVYFGGGTPSVLEAPQLDRLLTAVDGSFDMSKVREYTVECGRPDTVTADKLGALRRHGVGRISINPQTFNQQVLDNIGRRHTAEQSVKAYRLARTFGFESINMDLIAGLPGESVESFCASIDTALALEPENITVHTLSLKRSSQLAMSDDELSDGEAVMKMLDYASAGLDGRGYLPYYMYRQSKCLGNMENVGWCLRGKECLYNVFMMEECHSVLGTGAGAVTKLRAPHGDYIERVYNYKYPYEYNSGFDTLAQRKGRINEFYSTYK